ncbi:MAG: hypothetical protein DRI61_01760 [Chloroflexi bacterium]|nr:MAG: hypothetical protein DRI61_01760 [Chloroflexota bacterium]
MQVIVELLAKYARWFYVVCLLGAIYNLREAILARQERKQALFALEKEAALGHLYRTWAWTIVLIILLGFAFYMDKVVAPVILTPEPTQESLVNVLPLPTPTATPKPTPTPSPTPIRPRRTIVVPLFTPEPTFTPTPPPPVCPNPGVNITSPGVNAVLQGPVQVIGTANIQNFQYYKLEFGIGENPENWSFILSGNQPVINGVLGVWDPSPLPPGDYKLRLVVVDITGNFPPPCVVPVKIKK